MYSHLKVGDKILVVSGEFLNISKIEEHTVVLVSHFNLRVGENRLSFSRRDGYHYDTDDHTDHGAWRRLHGAWRRLFTKEELALASGKISLEVQTFLEKSEEKSK